MPHFHYTVKDAQGRTKSDVIEANDESSLVERLQADGFFIVKISPLDQKAPVVKSASGKIFAHKRIRTDDVIVFARQLSTMLDSGVILLRSLDVILTQVECEQFYEVLKKVRKDVEGGKPLSVALSRHPKVFNQMWISLVEVGEASGNMSTILNKLTFYIEQQAAFRSAVVSALVYPSVLFLVSVSAILFFALFVGPRFETIFQDLGAKLPGLTVAVLGLFRFIKAQFFVLLVGVVAGFFLLKKFISTNHGRVVFEEFVFRLPVFGAMYKLIIVERFSSQMAILMESGVPILYSLEISQKMVSNRTCALVIARVRESVRDGKMMSESMQQHSFFPAMAIQMIHVGEETGELGKMLKHVAAYYQNIVESFMKRFAVLIEPFLLVFMGAVIGTIVIAMFLPIFNLSRAGAGSG